MQNILQPARLFDFLYYRRDKFPAGDTFAAKENGAWVKKDTADVIRAVNDLAAGLIRMGIGGKASAAAAVEQQDKVALISRNRPEWLILDMACQQIGAVLCPIYPTTNAHELEFIFNDAGVKLIFFSGADIGEKIRAVQPRIPSLREVYSFDKPGGYRYWKDILSGISAENKSDAAETMSSIKPSHCATIIYTSGTTGTPKGVILSHANIVSNIINSKKSFPFDDDANGKTLSFLPLNHIFERLAAYIFIYSGHAIWFAESMETVGDNLREVRPTVFCTVPRLLEKVYERIMEKGAEQKGIKKKLFFWAVDLANKYDNLKSGGVSYSLQLALANKLVFSKWRQALGGNLLYVITGGAACQVRLLRIFNAARIPLFEGYGPTENSPVISVNRRTNGDMKFGTVGPPIEGQEVKLMEDGEICVKGPSVMAGYYKRPDLTAETVIDGWLHTGDIGVFEGKFLRITDRKKELFKTSGGKYVAPQPIENKLKESPLVEQVMIVGAEQKFVGALIVPSMLHLKEWMRAKNIPFTSPADAVLQPAVAAMYKSVIESFNENFNHVEQVKKFELLPAEWTIESGELTPTLKLKRKVIIEKFGDAIAKIYNG